MAVTRYAKTLYLFMALRKKKMQNFYRGCASECTPLQCKGHLPHYWPPSGVCLLTGTICASTAHCWMMNISKWALTGSSKVPFLSCHLLASKAVCLMSVLPAPLTPGCPSKLSIFWLVKTPPFFCYNKLLLNAVKAGVADTLTITSTNW